MTEKAVKALFAMPKPDAKRFIEKIELIAQTPYASLPFVNQNYRFKIGD
ncbi:type II toxin-antitoxin system RelE family toxin [Treponema endosymbiont of Eucomonympha sp.]|nr:hypothetical protein [Treponema endosymbiont of Eucomonympha sp.]